MTLSQFPMILEVDKMDYIAFSPEFLYQMAGMIRSGIGAVFSVGLYIVVLLLGLFTFLNFIRSIVE